AAAMVVPADMVVPVVEGGSRGAWRQWVVNRIDRETGRHFWGSPENFPVAATDGGWPEVVVVAGGKGGRSFARTIRPSSLRFRVSGKTRKLSGMLFYMKLRQSPSCENVI
nr:hypothetical protein [Tanacetum cinerariifolium]